MTEEQWLAATEPQVMLEWLGTVEYADERRLRLFACACARRLWHLLTQDRSRRAVEIAEQFADGQTTLEHLVQAAEAVDRRLKRHPRPVADEVSYFAVNAARDAAGHFATREHRSVAWSAAIHASLDAGGTAFWVAIDASALEAVYARAEQLGNWYPAVPDHIAGPANHAAAAEHAVQCRMLRCIVGNPFRPTPRIPPSVLAWNDGTVVKIASRVYDERDWSLLPILADALEDAGCSDRSILEHLRGPGPHAKGCWVLDLLLGRA